MIAETPLPHSILIPVALDHERTLTRKLALAHAMLAPGGKITLLTVLEKVPGFAAEFVTVKMENHLSAKVRAKLEAVAEGADNIDIRISSGKPGLEIADIAEEIGADLIIVGAHNPSAADYFLGSTASRVARRAKCSVHILR